MDVFATLEVASNCCHMLVQLNLELRVYVPYMPQQAETGMGNSDTHKAIYCIPAAGSDCWKTKHCGQVFFFGQPFFVSFRFSRGKLVSIPFLRFCKFSSGKPSCPVVFVRTPIF